MIAFTTVSSDIVSIHEIGPSAGLSLTLLPAAEDEQEEQTLDPLACYLREIARYPLLSEQEERTLLARVSQGDEQARTRLIEANLRLVVHVAKRYQSHFTSHMPLIDLIGYGNAGLVKAVDKYNSTFGVRFATYATYRIKAVILRALEEQSRLIRRSSYQIEQHRHLQAQQNDLTHELGRMPTLAELALYTGRSERSIEETQTVEQMPLSLDAHTTSHGLTFAEMLANEQTPDPLVTMCEQEQAQAMCDAVTMLLSSLTPREREVITCLFGLDGGGEREALVVAQKLGMGRSRVYQLFHSAMSKMRHAASAHGMSCQLFERCA